jgi:hypothetical protein
MKTSFLRVASIADLIATLVGEEGRERAKKLMPL